MRNKAYRTYDSEGMDKVAQPYKHAWIGFDAEALVENKDNVLLTDGNDNYALFEFHEPGVYYGHYLFTHHGARTLAIAQNLLDFFFRTVPCTEVRGLTPVTHKGALKLNKALGFKVEGMVDTEAGYHFVVSLKKEDYK